MQHPRHHDRWLWKGMGKELVRRGAGCAVQHPRHRDRWPRDGGARGAGQRGVSLSGRQAEKNVRVLKLSHPTLKQAHSSLCGDDDGMPVMLVGRKVPSLPSDPEGLTCRDDGAQTGDLGGREHVFQGPCEGVEQHTLAGRLAQVLGHVAKQYRRVGSD